MKTGQPIDRMHKIEVGGFFAAKYALEPFASQTRPEPVLVQQGQVTVLAGWCWSHWSSFAPVRVHSVGLVCLHWRFIRVIHCKSASNGRLFTICAGITELAQLRAKQLELQQQR